METLLELTAIYRVPLLWCGVILCAGSGLLGLVNPRFLEAVNSVSTKSFDSNRFFAVFDKSIDADQFFVKHARLFGVCAMATAAVLFYQIG